MSLNLSAQSENNILADERDKLRLFMNSIHRLPDDSFEAFFKVMDKVTYPKGEIIIKEGQTDHYTFFVLEGAQKVYHTNKNKEHIVHLTYPPAFAGIPESYLGNYPSNCFLECITKSTFLRFSRSSLGDLMNKDHQIERFVRKATTEVMVGIIDRYYALMSLTMEERFIKLMSENAPLLQLVPHKYIASYLNMDPTNFSKLLGTTKIG